MATLAGNSIASTYTMLLKMDASGVTSSLQKIEDGDATDSALSVSTVAAAIDATDKFYFDGGGNTYLHEVSADKLDIVVGGQTILELAEGGGGASDYAAIQALNKLYLDGGGTTYIQESADGIMDFYSDGVHMLSLDEENDEVVINEGSADIDFRVESNGNAGMLFIDGGNNRAGIGTSSPDSTLNISEDGQPIVNIDSYDNTDGNQAYVNIRKAAGTEASPGNVVDDESLGGVTWRGYHTDGHDTAAAIYGYVDGTPGNGDMPGRLLFLTTADGAGSPTERMRIDNAGNVGIGVAPTNGARLQLQGSSALNNVLQIGNYGVQSGRIASEGSLFITIDATDEDSGQGQSISFGEGGVDSQDSVMMTILQTGNVGIGDTDPSEAKLSITGVASGDNGIKVVQDQNTNAVVIDNNGTATALEINNTGSTGRGLYVYTNQNGDTSESLVNLVVDNAAFDEYALNIDMDGNQASIFIDSEATTNNCFQINAPASTSGHVLNMEGVDTLTTGSAIRVDAGGTSLASTAAGGLVEIMYDGAGTGINNLLFVKNDHASAVGTTGIYVQQDSTGPAISATGGIVEQGGALKENLLTNSGFDVWSNASLVEATGGAAPVTSGANSALTNNLLTNGAFDSATSSWTATTATLSVEGSGQTGNMLRITSDSGSSGFAYQDITTVIGKLYLLTYYIDIGTSSTAGVWVGITSDNDSILGFNETDTTTATSLTNAQHVFEATATTTRITLVSRDSSGTDYSEFDTVAVYEVTPGCIAADTKAFDGWTKDSTLDIWRQHHDSTYTKEGSFYSLKATSSAANDYIQWGSGAEDPAFVERFQGRTITFGCWVKLLASQSGDTSHVRLFITDGSSDTNGSYHSGGDNWEWLEVTATMGTATDSVKLRVMFDVSGKTAYVSQPMLVFGSSIGEGNYTRPMGEWVYGETQGAGNMRLSDNAGSEAGWGGTISNPGTINIEAVSYGRIPKGIKAIKGHVIATQATAGKYLAIRDANGSNGGITSYAHVNGAVRGFFYETACDANGDINVITDQDVTSANFYWDAVQLR